MHYTVKYKRLGDFFWKKIKNVKGDGILENIGIRFFILSDESRIEIPMQDTIFHFSKERFFLILESMEKETGQKIPVKR